MYDGFAWGETYRVTQDGGAPSVAVDDEGRIHVVWIRDWDVFYRGFDGAVWGEEGQLRAAKHMADHSSIAVGDDGRVHVVWCDDRDGDKEIYYKLGDSEQFAGVAAPPQSVPRLAITRLVPNPLAGEARVTFVLPSQARVEVSIFDVRGRLVWQEVLGVLDPGIHSTAWRTADRSAHPVSPGVYFVRLQAGEQAATVKAVVLR
jgi:hypothetical protein